MLKKLLEATEAAAFIPEITRKQQAARSREGRGDTIEQRCRRVPPFDCLSRPSVGNQHTRPGRRLWDLAHQEPVRFHMWHLHPSGSAPIGEIVHRCQVKGGSSRRLRHSFLSRHPLFSHYPSELGLYVPGDHHVRNKPPCFLRSPSTWPQQQLMTIETMLLTAVSPGTPSLPLAAPPARGSVERGTRLICVATTRRGM